MKKLILLLCVVFSLFALSKDINSRLYEKIITGIFPQKEVIYIYVSSPENFKFSRNIRQTKSIDMADLVIFNGGELKLHNGSKAVFITTHYKDMMRFDNVIGALFWKKGRPQILLKEEKLKENDLEIADYLKKYIE